MIPHDLESMCLKLVHLSMDFGLVNRQTKHPSGEPEADTTHTVMLGIMCCTVNQYLAMDLDDGMLAQMCLVHDLHEAYCGDIDTLRQDPHVLADKAVLEDIALRRLYELTDRMGVRQVDSLYHPDWLDWTGEMAHMYHSQHNRESRFIRAIDKLLPKLTHLLNGAVVLKDKRMTRAEFHDAIMVRQYQDMETYCHDLPQVLELHRLFGQRVEDLLPENYDER